MTRKSSRIFDLSKGRLDVSSVDPADLAQQLTLIEFETFKSIDPVDCIDASRKKVGGIKTQITWFNRVGMWVASEIVTHPNIKKRASVIKLFINVMQHCREYNNFNTLLEINAGLHTSPVLRLHRTWEVCGNANQPTNQPPTNQCAPNLMLMLTDHVRAARAQALQGVTQGNG